MPFPSLLGLDLPAAIAAVATVVASAATVVLFGLTMVLRISMLVARRRKRAVLDRWRIVFAESIRSERAAAHGELSTYAKRDALDLLEEWNHFRAMIDGQAADNLVRLAERLRLDAVAARLLHKRKLGARLLAIRTLGYCRSQAHWNEFAEHLDDSNTALSVTCAAALVHIDPAPAIPIVMPRVITRADWPRVTVAAMLRTAGPEHITMPLCNGALTAEAPAAVRLLGFSELLRPEVLEQLAETILRERSEPEVIAAVLKALPGVNGVAGLLRLTRHDAWYVRMQAARLLGRCARERDLLELERLLCDREWWVRYRAAQAIVSLPFMGPKRLRSFIARQSDRYAADMMYHAIAEVGL